MSYVKLKWMVDELGPDSPLVQGVIFDESSRCKNISSQRSTQAQKLTDMIRARYHFDGYAILMSGTPSPKKPTDWWSQAEIAWPGFLREGSVKAMERRMAFMVQKEFDSAVFWETIGWKDDERKCAECGEFEDASCHTMDNFMGELEEDDEKDYHKFVPSKNEVAYLYERLKGLAVIKHLKDCVQLPEKRYRKVVCKPKPSVLRVAKALVDSASNTMIGMTLLRELSDGFQYREEKDGMKPCGHCVDSCGEVDEWFDPSDDTRQYADVSMLPEEMVAKFKKRRVKCPLCKGKCEVVRMKRYAREVPCPKEAALRNLLEENWETGRIVIFAGFTGSVDRCVNICHKEKWAVVRCDGRGYQVTDAEGNTISGVEALDWWADLENNPRVAFVAHPESGGMSLTLVEARMAVYWSNSFKPEYRTQSEARIHRKGMDVNRGCTIVDLIHLPTDERVLEVIRDNRKLELMSMGEVMQGISLEDDGEGES
jgi:SNF2 family DNA or RNA helicase